MPSLIRTVHRWLDIPPVPDPILVGIRAGDLSDGLYHRRIVSWKVIRRLCNFCEEKTHRNVLELFRSRPLFVGSLRAWPCVQQGWDMRLIPTL